MPEYLIRGDMNEGDQKNPEWRRKTETFFAPTDGQALEMLKNYSHWFNKSVFKLEEVKE